MQCLSARHSSSTAARIPRRASCCGVHGAQQRHRRWRVRAVESDNDPGAPLYPPKGQMISAFTSTDEWRQLDKKVNKYPSQRTFSAVGTGGDDLAAAVVRAVEEVLGAVHVECVQQRPSSGGKYTAVRVGPVWVQNGEQVIRVFENIRADERVKWYM